MADRFPDLHNAMSKKVAQLTKVIFHLNSRNDENDLVVQSIVSSYEKEMTNIVASANTIVQKANQANNVKDALKEIERGYEDFRERVESEKAKAVMEFDRFKRSAEEKEKDAKIATDRKLAAYEQETKQLQSKLETLQKALQKISDSYENNKDSHQRELGDYVKKQNEK